MLGKAIDAVSFAQAYSKSVEHQHREASFREAMGQRHVVFAGHVISVGHDYESFWISCWEQDEPLDQRTFVGETTESFMMQVRMFLEIVIDKTCGF